MVDKVHPTYATRFMGKVVEVVIDRPIGSKHPKCDIHYVVNYGYVPKTKAPDGDEVDAYVLGAFEPIKRFKGRCIAVIHRTNDEDAKLIIVPDGVLYSDEQIYALTEFQERFFKSVILRKKV